MSELVIQRGAIVSNWHLVRRVALGATVAPVVKADGYGLGAVRVSRLLWREGARNFFVFSFAEGLELRQVLPKNARIMLLGGLPLDDKPMTFAREAIASRLLPVISTREQLAVWREAGRAYGRKHNSPLPLVLHFDLGMNRYALSQEELRVIVRDPQTHFENLRPALWMAHLSSAERQEQETNHQQKNTFEIFAKLLPKAPLSLANSAGVALGKEWHFNLVRPGAALYGLEASAFARHGKIQRAGNLRVRVVQIQEVKAGATVGYNETWRADKKTRLATVAFGYADGLAVRALATPPQKRASDTIRAPQLALWYKGVALPVRGRISMDLASVEATSAPHLQVGDWLDLFPPEECAQGQMRPFAETLPYSRDALCALGARVKRVFV